MMPYTRLFLMALLCFGCVEDSETPGSHSSDGSPQADSGAEGGTDGAASSVDAERPGPDARVEPIQDAETPPTDAMLPPNDAGMMSDARASESDAAEPGADAAVDRNRGHVPTSCGAEQQGIMPVDCTAEGDQNAQCVFSNHCMCSEGFRCQLETMWPGTQECDPGAICVPEDPIQIGSDPRSCGAEQQGQAPIDCTAGGDENAFCVFGDHCACSEGYVCEVSGQPGECEPGEGCRVANSP